MQKGKTTKELFGSKADKALGFVKKHICDDANLLIIAKNCNDNMFSRFGENRNFPDHHIMWTNKYIELDKNKIFKIWQLVLN